MFASMLTRGPVTSAATARFTRIVSALGQKRTLRQAHIMSSLPPIADIRLMRPRGSTVAAVILSAKLSRRHHYILQAAMLYERNKQWIRSS